MTAGRRRFANDARTAPGTGAMPASIALVGIAVALLAMPVAGQTETTAVDYLTLANGAVPVRVGGAGAAKGATLSQALQIVDGSPFGFPVVNRATDETDVEFVFELPALTTFTRFAVPNVLETPSPSQTFFRSVEVHGTAAGADSGYVLLASATLATHAKKDLFSELAIHASAPVRWVKVRLVGGIVMTNPSMFLEFSEIIGNGSQAAVPMSDAFAGKWRARGIMLDLQQAGPVVSGCFDGNGDLTGTVSGRILRATGIDRKTGVKSAFVLAVAEDGGIRGVRSTNGAPFRLYEAAVAPAGTVAACKDVAPAKLGCGSIIHGIEFAYDSAELRPESEPVLAELFRGLQSETEPTIVIEGHTSSEGSTEYNQVLSERRAATVRADLLRRGLPAERLRAVGIGEARPIAPNDDESGRAINRRVEIRCS